MPTRDERWPAGTPCWVDLSTPDVAAAQEFYGTVLGWDFREAEGGYWLCLCGGREAAGMMALQAPEQPVAWTVYFASDDVDAHAKAITDAGGTLVLAPMEAGAWGRLAVGADPTGATFGLWQASELPGVRVYNEPGSLTWEDAAVTDTAAAQAFYASVFGFTFTPMEGGDDYATFALGGDPLGGLGGLGQDDRPGWTAYFAVADADLAVAAAAGGRRPRRRLADGHAVRADGPADRPGRRAVHDHGPGVRLTREGGCAPPARARSGVLVGDRRS